MWCTLSFIILSSFGLLVEYECSLLTYAAEFVYPVVEILFCH